MINDIDYQIGIIESSIEWADKFGKDTFPKDELKEFRRQIRRIANSLEGNCSAAAYGESQVGKSYLISSLLSTPERPFVITNQGQDYSFIDEINPSGGSTSKTESTGVITRFTIDVNCKNERLKDKVRIKNLSIADIIMLLVDSYYNDLKIAPDRILRYDKINEKIGEIQYLWEGKSSYSQNYLTEDDIKDICEYIRDVVGANAVAITQSDFEKLIPAKIQYIDSEDWVKVFSLLWNDNQELNKLFTKLIEEYQKLKFQTEVYVPFEAVLRKKGTLLKIEWLDQVCGMQHGNTKEEQFVDVSVETHTEVYDKQGNLLESEFPKSYLSALIAELTFTLPPELAKNREFLRKIDLLDFPGARSREKIKDEEISKVLPTILRRGKVAYLFNKYSRSLRISSVLFSHHNDQKSEATLGETINDWIERNIGKTPKDRTEYLSRTNGVSPLFFVATKFNIELERTKNDKDRTTLNEHWKRFKTVFPEIIKPATWFDKWVIKGDKFSSEKFQSIYPLRDFYWSCKNQVFKGYKDGISPETKVHEFDDYPGYFADLRESFLSNDFVEQHFAKPEETWNSVATLNNDGSKVIIRDLNKISAVLDSARKDRYQKELKEINDKIAEILNGYYEPENREQNNQKTKAIVGAIKRRLDFTVSKKSEIFGSIIDNLMLPVSDIRKIVYDIVILKLEIPKDFDTITLIRKNSGIMSGVDKQQNIQKLCNYYHCDEQVLQEEFAQQGFSVDDVVSQKCTIAATTADVVSEKILEHWNKFINQQVTALDKFIPHSDRVALMLQVLCKRLGVGKVIAEKVDTYIKVFAESDLPNAIADFSAVILNNFVSTVGREYMKAEDLATIEDKAKVCDIEIDLSPSAIQVKHEQINILDALQAFDDATDTVGVSIDTLKKLPFWDNFQRWKNLLNIGLLYAADVSHCDPIANAEIKEIINKCSQLYK